MNLQIVRTALRSSAAGLVAGLTWLLPVSPAGAAPNSVTCLATVAITYDDSRYVVKGGLPAAEGPCELALDTTPASPYGVQFMSLGGSPKDFQKLKKLKPNQRIQLLADQMAGGNKAAPVQDVEAVGVFSMGFSVAQGPSGAIHASHIATAAVGKALLYVVLEHRPERDPKAAPFDRSAARSELLSLLAGVRIGAPAAKK